MKTNSYTEKLFCAALLNFGTDITAEVLAKYIELRDSKKFEDWLEIISKENK